MGSVGSQGWRRLRLIPLSSSDAAVKEMLFCFKREIISLIVVGPKNLEECPSKGCMARRTNWKGGLSETLSIFGSGAARRVMPLAFGPYIQPMGAIKGFKMYYWYGTRGALKERERRQF
jgi:hypothetical protein